MKKEIQIAITHICTEFGCTPMELNDRDRHRPLPDARKAVTYFLTSYTNMGVEEIAATMSRDHSSVSSQYGKAMDLMETNVDFKRHIESVRPTIKNILSIDGDILKNANYCPTCGHKLKGHEA